MGTKNDGEVPLDDLENANIPSEIEETVDATGLEEPDEIDIWAEVEESLEGYDVPTVHGEVKKYYKAIRDLMCILFQPEIIVIDRREGKTNGHVTMLKMKATPIDKIRGGCRRKELTDYLEMHELSRQDPEVQKLIRSSRNIFQASFNAQVELELGALEMYGEE